jgi:type VI secretion system secreted protein Hcp
MSQDEARRGGLPRRSLTIALPTVAALGAGSALAVGAIPSADGTIQACYYTGTDEEERPGALRVVDDEEECQSDEDSLAWNQRGPRGEQGLPGPRGADGRAGAAGPAGAAGAPGPAGPQGPQGPKGEQGPAGSGGVGGSGGSSSGGGVGTFFNTSNSDIFLKIDGIEGSSKSKSYEKWIQLESFSWGLTNAGTQHSGGAGSSGKVSLQDFSLAKLPDASTTDFIQNGATGKHHKDAFVEVTRQSSKGNPMKWMSYKFEDVLITGYGVGGTSENAMETATLNFGKVAISTYGADSSGVIRVIGTATYDVKNNKK